MVFRVTICSCLRSSPSWMGFTTLLLDSPHYAAAAAMPVQISCFDPLGGVNSSLKAHLRSQLWRKEMNPSTRTLLHLFFFSENDFEDVHRFSVMRKKHLNPKKDYNVRLRYRISQITRENKAVLLG